MVVVGSRYDTARGIAGFMTIAGWVVVGLSLFGILMTMINKGPPMAFAIAIGLCINGLLIVASGQALRALLDIADNSWKLVESERQLIDALISKLKIRDGTPSDNRPASEVGELMRLQKESIGK